MPSEGPRRTKRLTWGKRTFVMGILNVTPDSFSGDGLAPTGRSEAEVVSAALDQARAFVAGGAEILDIGAESSRPAAVYGQHPAVDVETELNLAIPVVEALTRAFGEDVLISIDTTKAQVARAALAAGAGMVNDVWAARRDPGTADAAAAAGAYLVVMHNKDVAEYPSGVLPEVIAWLRSAAESAAEVGVARDRIVVDPGIGFGKTPEHSLEVLHRLGELKAALDLPLLVGTSRKRFIGEILDGAPPDNRLEGTAASSVLAIAAGADVVRVHDVAAVTRAVRVADAIVRRPTPVEPAPELSGQVAVHGIRATGRHGVGEDERSREQPFEVDVVARLDVAQAVAGDDLERTVDYAAVQGLVIELVSATTFRLVETLAAAIGDTIIGRWTVVDEVEVAVRKLQAPLTAPFERVEARIRMTRNR